MGLKFENGQWSLLEDATGGDLKNIYIDLTDPSWTFQDIPAMAGGPAVQSVSHASDVNSVVFNAISAGASNQITQATYNGPRWYKPLTDNSGNQITTNDFFQMTLRIDPQNTPTAPCSSCVMIGISESPTSFGSSNMKTAGLALIRNNASNSTGFLDSFLSALHGAPNLPIYGPLGGWSSTGNFCQANITKIRPTKVGIFGTQTANDSIRDQSFPGSFSPGLNLYLTVAMFFRFNSDEALLNADEDWKLSYNISRIS